MKQIGFIIILHIIIIVIVIIVTIIFDLTTPFFKCSVSSIFQNIFCQFI